MYPNGFSDNIMVNINIENYLSKLIGNTYEEFEELKGLLAKNEYNSEDKQKIINKMKVNLFIRNNNDDSFILDNGTERQISESTPTELIEMNATMRERICKKERDQINDTTRENQISKNKYSKNNPYPQTNNK